MRGCGVCSAVALALLIQPRGGFGQGAAAGCQPAGAVPLSPAEMKARLRYQPPAPPLPPLVDTFGIGPTLATVRVGTNQAGDVTCVQAVRGHPLLLGQALELVKTWKFYPTSVAGQPQPTAGTLVLMVSAPRNHAIEAQVLDEEPPPPGAAPPVRDDAKTPGEMTAGDCPGTGAVQLSPAQMKAGLRHAPPISSDLGGMTFGRLIVTVRIRTDADGAVACALGVSGHPLAQAAALQAVRNWQFQPTAVGGQPQPTAGTLVLAISRANPGIETQVLDEEPATAAPPPLP